MTSIEQCNVPGVLFSSNGIWMKWNEPWCDANAVFSLFFWGFLFASNHCLRPKSTNASHLPGRRCNGPYLERDRKPAGWLHWCFCNKHKIGAWRSFTSIRQLAEPTRLDPVWFLLGRVSCRFNSSRFLKTWVLLCMAWSELVDHLQGITQSYDGLP